jgi:uncharacterized RDD family membrane protein YckC
VELPGLGSLRVATVGERLLARLVDGLILTAAFVVLYFIGLGSLFSTSRVDASGNAIPSGFGLGIFFTVLTTYVAISLFYEVAMIALRGQTLGKMALGVKVILERNGQIPGWGPSFVRWIIPAIGAFVCSVGQLLVYVSVLFDDSGRNQGWHDKAAKDLVISTKSGPLDH